MIILFDRERKRVGEKVWNVRGTEECLSICEFQMSIPFLESNSFGKFLDNQCFVRVFFVSFSFNN